MDKISIRDLLIVMFKRWKTLIAVFVLIVGAVTLANVTATPYYESNASILLKFGREHVVKSELGTDMPQMEIQAGEMITSEMEILGSIALARNTVEEIGWQKLYPGIGRKPTWDEGITWVRYQLRRLLNGEDPEDSRPEMAAQAFARDLTIEPVAKSSVVNVTYEHWDPQVAAQAVNTHIEKFKEKRLAVFSDPKSKFLVEQLQLISDELQKAESRYDAFRQEYSVFDLEQQRKLLLERQNTIGAELDTTQGEIAENTERLTALSGLMQKTPRRVQVSSSSGRTAVNDSAEATLYELRMRREELLTKYKPGTPFIQDIDRQIAQAENLRSRQTRSTATGSVTGVNPIYEQLESEFATARTNETALAAKEATLRAQLGAVNKRLQELDSRYGQLQMLTRDVESTTRQFETFRQLVDEAEIAENANREKQVNVSVIERATPSIRPSSPQKTLNIALAMMFSLGFGIGLIFLLEYARSVFITPEMAAKKLGLPVLGSIPYYKAT